MSAPQTNHIDVTEESSMTTETSTPDQRSGKSPRVWPVLLLALPAFVAIWSGWVELGRLTGFGPVSPLPGIWDEATIDTAITLPIGVETYAAYAMYVWLALNVSAKARTFARVSAIGSLILGAGGQVAYHLMAAAGMTRAPWPITATVACLPVIVLGMGAALAHLVRHEPAETEPQVATKKDAEPAATEDTDAPAEDAPEAQGETEPETTEPDRPARRDQPQRKIRTNAEKARAMRKRYPNRTYADIAERLGVTERTVSRYFSPAVSADVAEPDDIAA
ncbi:hypothetical protein Kisp02_01900 [Kineosporia sp. NBRC 101731]|nr:helix-turn-helix transcriptional regulator [Kineosporia sp. NBRC 101731]GLY26825.1 hypothetical protein Kisp02_01900 [Kineosporia sp. NBRC 101731]